MRPPLSAMPGLVGALLATATASAAAPESGTAAHWHEAEYPAAEAAWECAKQGRQDCARARPHSSPETLGPGRHLHDGFFLRAGLGVTYVRARLDASSQASFTATGRGTTIELWLGGTPWQGVVLGGGYFLTGIDDRSGPSLFGFGAFTQIYPDPKTGFHVQALACLSSLMGVQPPWASTELRSERGALLSAGLGYDFWIGSQTSLGLFARGGYSRQFENTGASVGFGTLGGAFTWH